MSNQDVHRIFERRGQVLDSERVPAVLLGTKSLWPDTDPTDGVTLLSGAEVTMIVMKNSSSGTLAARDTVIFKTGTLGKEIGAVGGAGAMINGVVDDHVDSNGVADGKVFLMAVAGPHDCKSGAAITEYAALIPVATGDVDDSSTPDELFMGIALEAASGAAENIRCLLAIPGW